MRDLPPPPRAEWISGHAIIPDWPSWGGSQQVCSAADVRAALDAAYDAGMRQAAKIVDAEWEEEWCKSRAERSDYNRGIVDGIECAWRAILAAIPARAVPQETAGPRKE